MHPVTEQVLVNGIDYLGRSLVERAVNNNPDVEDEITRETINRLDEIQKDLEEIKENNPENEEVIEVEYT